MHDEISGKQLADSAKMRETGRFLSQNKSLMQSKGRKEMVSYSSQLK